MLQPWRSGTHPVAPQPGQEWEHGVGAAGAQQGTPEEEGEPWKPWLMPGPQKPLMAQLWHQFSADSQVTLDQCLWPCEEAITERPLGPLCLPKISDFQGCDTF